ncbi:hypothetical protein KC367_g179 [Hortaea werneckii]|nr:hypothetical protein KC367_g179 [Hortaea werneckii]
MACERRWVGETSHWNTKSEVAGESRCQLSERERVSTKIEEAVVRCDETARRHPVLLGPVEERFSSERAVARLLNLDACTAVGFRFLADDISHELLVQALSMSYNKRLANCKEVCDGLLDLSGHDRVATPDGKILAKSPVLYIRAPSSSTNWSASSQQWASNVELATCACLNFLSVLAQNIGQFSRRVFGKAFSARRARSVVTTSPFSHSVRSSGSRLPMFGWRARTVASSVGVIRVSVTFLADSSSTSPTGSAQHLPDEKDITSDSIAWSNILKAKTHIVRQNCGPVRISNAFRLADHRHLVAKKSR